MTYEFKEIIKFDCCPQLSELKENGWELVSVEWVKKEGESEYGRKWLFRRERC